MSGPSVLLRFTPAEVYTPTSCDEVGPVTRQRVSAYQRTRTQRVSLVRGERRCIVTDFRGVFGLTRAIASAVIRVNNNAVVVLSDASCDDTTVSVTMTTQVGGVALVKVEATLDNGESYNAVYRIDVRGGPWFAGETYSGATGPTSLSATNT